MNVSNVLYSSPLARNNHSSSFRGQGKIQNSPNSDVCEFSKSSENVGENDKVTQLATELVNFANMVGGKQARDRAVALVTALVMATTLSGCGDTKDRQVPTGTDYYIAETQPLDSIKEEVGEYGVPMSVILRANGVSSFDEALKEKGKIIIPSKYEYTNDIIAEKEAELESGKLSKKKQEQLKSDLADLKYATKLQDETAKVYADSKAIYYQISKPVKALDFKNIFWIKDGVIVEHNRKALTPTYKVARSTLNDQASWMDFDEAVIEKGTIISIPIDGIRK